MKSNSGSVLISVLAVSVILSILLISLFSAAAWAYRRSMGKLPRRQAHYTAMAGINAVENIIKGINANDDTLADDPDGVRDTIIEFVKEGYEEGSDKELTITLNFGNDFGVDSGKCDLVLKNMPVEDNAGVDGEVEITAKVTLERTVDENGQLIEDEDYKISLIMGWTFDFDGDEDLLFNYMERMNELDSDHYTVLADTYFWYIEDSATFIVDEDDDENPLAYVDNDNHKALFIFIMSSEAPVDLGNIGWDSAYDFDVYVIITGEKAITGLEGLSNYYVNYDISAGPWSATENDFPENVEQQLKFDDEDWHVLHYVNPYTTGGGLQSDDLRKADIFTILSDPELDYWKKSSGISFDDEKIRYIKP